MSEGRRLQCWPQASEEVERRDGGLEVQKHAARLALAQFGPSNAVDGRNPFLANLKLWATMVCRYLPGNQDSSVLLHGEGFCPSTVFQVSQIELITHLFPAKLTDQKDTYVWKPFRNPGF